MSKKKKHKKNDNKESLGFITYQLNHSTMNTKNTNKLSSDQSNMNLSLWNNISKIDSKVLSEQLNQFHKTFIDSHKKFGNQSFQEKIKEILEKVNKISQEVSTQTYNILNSSTIDNKTILKNAKFYTEELPQKIKELKEQLLLINTDHEQEITYFDNENLQSTTLTAALKQELENLIIGSRLWVQELKKIHDNKKNNTHQLLENLSCFNNVFSYFKLKVNDLVQTDNNMPLSIENLNRIIKFDKALSTNAKPVVKNMRSLLDVPNSDAINDDYYNNVTNLIKNIKILKKKMNRKTNSLIKFSNEHKITRKNYNVLKSKLNSFIKKIESLLKDKKSHSVLEFAKEIIKGQMLLANYYSSNTFYAHKIQRIIEDKLGIEQKPFPEPIPFQKIVQSWTWQLLTENIKNKVNNISQVVSDKTDNILNSSTIDNKTILKNAKFYTKKLPLMINELKEILDITVTNEWPVIEYFNNDHIESLTLIEALKEQVTSLSNDFEGLIKTVDEATTNNQEINLIALLELFTLFNTQLTYVKNTVTKIVSTDNNASAILSEENLKITRNFDDVISVFVEEFIKNKSLLLGTVNSDAINKDYHNNVRNLIQIITNLLNTMNTETDSLTTFSNEHEITKENYNVLSLKLNNVIKKLESLLIEKNASVFEFAKEILKGQNAIIDFYGSNIYHTHKTERIIEKTLNIPEREFPIQTFDILSEPQVMALRTNNIYAIESNHLVYNTTNKPFSNLPAIVSKAEDLASGIAIGVALVIGAFGGIAAYKFLKQRWDDNIKRESNNNNNNNNNTSTTEENKSLVQ